MVVLKTNNLTKEYKGITVVDHVNMTINQGDIYGFVGKNGAGKTTLMRMVLNLAKPTEGEIELFESKNLLEGTRRVGSLIETPSLYKGMTAENMLKQYAILYGANPDSIGEILKFVDLADVGKKAVGQFSLGMKQRMGIAIALLGSPDFLILDEPVNGLDPVGMKNIRDIIIRLNQERGITFLISSHLLEELAKTATKFGIINDGLLVEEISAEQLEKACESRLMIMVNDPAKAMKLLSEKVDMSTVSCTENRIVFTKNFDQSHVYNRILVEGGVDVFSLSAINTSLEQFYMERIGAYRG